MRARTYRRFPWATALAALTLAIAWGITQGQEETAVPGGATEDISRQTAEVMPLAAKSLILDVTGGPDRAIAVGERGHVLVSDTPGRWRQVEGVPTRSTLTSVTAIADKVWAVGHDGVILHSDDGGDSWTRQRESPYDPDSDDPHNGVPFLDVLFLDEANGIAVGAYSMVFKTADAGQTWTAFDIHAGGAAAAEDGEAAGDELEVEVDDGSEVADEAAVEDQTFDASELELEEESDPHLNAIVRTGDGSLFVVAERGSAFRSSDGGASFARIQLPYDGSMFGAIGYEAAHVLAFGLRGNVFESFDLGDTWKKIDSGVDLSIMGGVGWKGGGAALVGANGVVLTRSAGGAGLLKHTFPEGGVLSSVLPPGPGGELVVVGENGIASYTPK